MPCHTAVRRGVTGTVTRGGGALSRRLVSGLALGAMACASRAGAQDAPRAAGPGFLVARYATRSSLAFYGGYQLGAGFGVIGLVQNPRTGYREALVGAGWHPFAHLTVALAAANTSDGWFTQGYVLPSARLGRLDVDGTIVGYLPLQRRGSAEVDLSPLVAILALSRAVGIGAADYLSLPQRGAASHAAGPALRFAIPSGSVTLELLRGLSHAPTELHLVVRTSR